MMGMWSAASCTARAGEDVLATGEQTILYRELRELSCSRCAGVIDEGELFTREADPASGLPLVRLCRGCAPFSSGGGLLDLLLTPARGEEPRPITAPGDAREKVLSRLGPALAVVLQKIFWPQLVAATAIVLPQYLV
jgi:hypothetical protein